MTQVKLALEASEAATPFRGLVYLFWGLIFAKCFLAEWAVRFYAMPFDSLYVWLPTLVFGAVCTWVYAGVHFPGKRTTRTSGRFVSAVWTACVGGMALLAVEAVGFGIFNPFLLPGMMAILFGVGYTIHGVLDHHWVYRYAAGGWWLSAVALLARPTVHALAWLALALLLFQVLPGLVLYLNWRRHEQKRRLIEEALQRRAA